MVTIQRVSGDAATARLSQWVALLVDSVDNGASVGFLPPLSATVAEEYWRGVIADLSQHKLLLWAALDDDNIVGSVQLHPSPKLNGTHRAEVAKLLVHSAHRRQGIGRALMTALENEAQQAGRTTLVLDTRQGDGGEHLYRELGYRQAGVIPQYVHDANGVLEATVIYYKLLA